MRLLLKNTKVPVSDIFLFFADDSLLKDCDKHYLLWFKSSRNRCVGLDFVEGDVSVVEENGVQLGGREGNVVRNVPTFV